MGFLLIVGGCKNNSEVQTPSSSTIQEGEIRVEGEVRPAPATPVAPVTNPSLPSPYNVPALPTTLPSLPTTLPATGIPESMGVPTSLPSTLPSSYPTTMVPAVPPTALISPEPPVPPVPMVPAVPSVPAAPSNP